MASVKTVARPYAKAVFQQAKADNRLEQWSLVLHGLALITADSRVKNLCNDPKITAEAMMGIVYETLREAVSDAVISLSDKLKNFLSLLIQEKRLLASDAIQTLYHQFVSDYKSVLEVEVISAFALDNEQQKAFYTALERRFASKISIAFKEDNALIGGAMVRSGNWVLDGSVRGKLSRLAEALH